MSFWKPIWQYYQARVMGTEPVLLQCIVGEDMTFKQLTMRVAKIEGGKKNVNIAQISEITKIVLQECAKMSHGELGKLLSKYE